MTVKEVSGYEGANPQDPSRIKVDGNTVGVRPESEDGDSNYKFAFDVTLRNPADSPQPVELTVDWQEPPDVGTRYMQCRRSIFVAQGDTWREVAGKLDADKVHFQLDVPPGDTRLCLHPPFWTDDLEAFFQAADALPGTQRIGYGRSAEQRTLEAAWLPATRVLQRCVLAIGRIHPYETAGSHFVVGILGLLDSEHGRALRESTAFLLAPLVNPDGVAHGLCKRSPTGTELSTEALSSSDPAATALRALLCGIAAATPRPVLIDAHGWMIHEDGPIFYSTDLADDVLPQLSDDLFPHGFRVKDYSTRPADPDTNDLRRFAVEQLGMHVLVTSHAWFGRQPATMRRIGAELTGAFLAALG
jgi:hypothetical protein